MSAEIAVAAYILARICREAIAAFVPLGIDWHPTKRAALVTNQF